MAGREAVGNPKTSKRLCSLMFIALLAMGFVPGKAFADHAGLQRIGTLPVDPSDGLVPDAREHQIIAMGGGLGTLTLTTFDANRLTILRRASFDSWWPQEGIGGKPRVWSFDEAQRQLFLIAYGSKQQRDNFALPNLVQIDIDTLGVVSSVSLEGVFPPGVRILGMSPAGSGFMLIGQAAPSVNSGQGSVDAPRSSGVLLARINDTGSLVGQPIVVRSCQQAITNQTQAVLGIDGSNAYIGCATSQLSTVPVPGVQAVVRVNLADVKDQQVFFLPGSYENGDVYYDAAARRLLLVGSTPGSPAQAVWVFDLEHQTFVGQVASGDVNVLGAGLNPETGRMYVGIDGAVLVSNGRGRQIPQAISFDLNTNDGAITPIPFASSVVIPTRGQDGEFIVSVFRDSIPESEFSQAEPAPYESLDSLTASSPQFAADVQAFGLRVHMIGGFNAQVQNVFPFGLDYWQEPGSITGLKDGDRDLHFARVTRAHLSADEASAEAVAADRDSNTVTDYQTLSSKRPGTIPTWGYDPSQCGDFGTTPYSSTTTGTSVSCSDAAHSVTASASYVSPLTIENPIAKGTLLSVGSTSSWTTLIRDATDVLGATVHSEARNIAIADRVYIEKVASDVTVASGKKGQARGSYSRSIQGVIIDGRDVCGSTCDITSVATQISDALGSQVRVELPAADVMHTNGGAHGHAIRDPWQLQQDIVINNQQDTEQQVPALRLIFVNDKTLASRLIVELAATKGDSTSIRVVPEAPIPPEPVVVKLPVPAPINAPVQNVVTVGKPVVTTKTQSPLSRLVNILGHGWKLLFGSTPAAMVRGVALWLLLLSPAFFAMRRSALMRKT
ncbi:MAG: hypothetical protein ACYDCC_05630 [Actinomycetota bacterium]